MSHLLPFPDDDNQIGSWLESLLISPDFAINVSQLSGLGVDEIQGDATPIEAEAFYQSAATGLSHLSVEQCRWLLRNREQLLRLNGKILEFESHYWMSKLKAPLEDVPFNRVADSTSSQRQVAAQTTGRRINLRSNTRSGESESRRLRSNLRKLISMAAGLLFCFLGLAAYQMTAGGQADSWGWQTHEFAQKTGTRGQYFSSLDQSLKQWYDQPKVTGEQLASSLNQLSKGCDRLISSAHEPLSKSDKDWLREKCSTWKKAIGKLALAAKAGSDLMAVGKVKGNADDLVSRISLAIENRIQESAG